MKTMKTTERTTTSTLMIVAAIGMLRLVTRNAGTETDSVKQCQKAKIIAARDHGGTRSANVIADELAICYVLPIVKLDELAALHPEIQTNLVFNIARELSARLRRADAEIRSLEE